MQNEAIEPSPKSRPVLARILIPLCWTLWGILLVVALYGLVTVSTEQASSPEARRGLGIFAILFLMALLAVAAVLLNVAARKQSSLGLITMTLVLAYPLVSLVAHPAIQAYKRRSFASAEARVGDFRDPMLKSMARAINANDTRTLTQLLKGEPPPEGKDRAGNDLLAYALVVVRDKQGSADPVRVLLDTGADPRRTRAGNGEDVVNFMIYGGSPATREAMRLLLEHGADPDAVDPQSGKTPIGTVYNEPELVRLLVVHGADIDRIQPDGVPAVVSLISTQQWESALYLIEKGANLDVRNTHGLSVDYYLNDWKESVSGEHPEGWDKVREAIAKRRASGR